MIAYTVERNSELSYTSLFRVATQNFEEIQEQFKNISRTKYWFSRKEIFFKQLQQTLISR